MQVKHGGSYYKRLWEAERDEMTKDELYNKGLADGFDKGLAAGRAEVQKRIDESPVATFIKDDDGWLYMEGHAQGPEEWDDEIRLHLVPVEPKEEA